MKTRTKRKNTLANTHTRVDHVRVEQGIKNCGLQADDFYER